MNIEIINVGTELLLGEIVNTNATYLQKMCKDLGFNVFYQSVVGDNPDRFKYCLKIAFERGADCVITTGGLGPTTDDLTKELSAEFLGLPMVLLDEEAKKVEQKCLFVSNNQKVPENNFKQAWFPKDCYILDNEVGTANGCVMQKDGKMIINLPGPPKEMTYICQNELIPYLSAFKKETIYTKDIVTVGFGESALELALKEIIESQKRVSIALYASEQTVRIRLGCKAKDKETAMEQIKPIEEHILKVADGFIVAQSDMTKALLDILPPFEVEYKSGFRFRPEFILARNTGKELLITVDSKMYDIGEKLYITFKYKGKEKEFSIGLLKKAELSHSKLESRIINNLYAFLK